ncbi:MAG: hypothetical protein IT370_34180 [Deltaproteobacteria bacterium]|nr:hypothetical protein [Deltaproteobacteria bacterium]
MERFRKRLTALVSDANIVASQLDLGLVNAAATSALDGKVELLLKDMERDLPAFDSDELRAELAAVTRMVQATMKQLVGLPPTDPVRPSFHSVRDQLERLNNVVGSIFEAVRMAPGASQVSHPSPLRVPMPVEPPIQTSVLFMNVRGISAMEGGASRRALSTLHSELKKGLQLPQPGVRVLACLTGAIVLVPDSCGREVVELLAALAPSIAGAGIAIQVGISHGEVELITDADGTTNAIGVCINTAARLAVANTNPGVLVHTSYALGIAQDLLPRSHWVRSKANSVEVSAKHGVTYSGFAAPVGEIQMLEACAVQSAKADDFMNALLLSYDLPGFSQGDQRQLASRFRSVVGEVQRLQGETNLAENSRWFSPGGDGGILAMADFPVGRAVELATRLRQFLSVETDQKSSAASVRARIGVHYAPVFLYETAEGGLRPTGAAIFAVDAIASDDEARKFDGAVIVSDRVIAAVSLGSARVQSEYEKLPDLVVADGARVGRFMRRDHRSLTSGVGDSARAPDVNYDQQIDEARELLRRREPGAARDLLEKLQRRVWDRLSPRQRFRVLVNLGATCVVQGRTKEGAALYIKAAMHQPEDPDAQSYVAKAHELLGEHGEAFRIARPLVEVHKCERAAVVFVRTAPASESLHVLLESVSLWLDRMEVLFALCDRANRTGEYTQAVELGRRLDAIAPTEPWGPLHVGNALFGLQTAALRSGHRGPSAPVDRAGLKRAESSLSVAISRCVTDEYDQEHCDAYVARSRVRFLLGDTSGELDDLEQAGRLRPNDPDVLLLRAEKLLVGDRSRAIALIREAVGCAIDDWPALFLAMVLEDDVPTQVEALAIYRRLSENSRTLGEPALVNAVKILIAQRLLDDADSLVRAAAVSECLKRALEASVEAERGNLANAAALAERALEGMRNDEPAVARRTLAVVLGRVGHKSSALAIWRTLAVAGMKCPDTLSLIQCAHEVQDHALVLEQCRLLRENGSSDETLIEVEAGLLQFSDPRQCYNVLSEYARANPGGRMIALWLSMAAYRLGLLSEVVVDLGRLPDAAEDLEIGRRVVRLLMDMGVFESALAHAYEILRCHWTEHEAHVLYIQSFFGIPQERRPAQPARVAPGVAVCYQEIGGQGQHWLVIEDGPRLREGEETRADGPRARPFMGRVVGEAFALSQGANAKRVEIVALATKYLRRVHDSMDQFGFLFPERDDVQSVTVSTSGAPLADEQMKYLVRVNEERAVAVGAVLEHYRGRALSLSSLSQALREHPIVCQLDVAMAEGIEVCAGDGDLALHEAAVDAAVNRQAVLVDVSAVATIVLLGLRDDLWDAGWTWRMTYATRDAVLSFARGSSRTRESSRLVSSPSGLAFVAMDTEWWSRVAVAAAHVVEQCQVVPTPAFATLRPEDRSLLLGLHQQWGAETIVASLETDCVLWTDDLSMAVSSRQRGGVAVGTQGLLDAAVLRGTVGEATRDENSARLAGYEYQGIFLREGIVQASCRLADYDPVERPLRELRALIGREQFPVGPAAAISAMILKEIHGGVVLPERRNAFGFAIIEALGGRKDALVGMRLLRRTLVSTMGLNVVASAEMLGLIDAFIRMHPQQALLTLS